MTIRLIDIFPIETPSLYKVHFAVFNGENQPLDVFVRNHDKWKDWQESPKINNIFNRQYIFSLINFYHDSNPNIWLFGGIWEVRERTSAGGYKVQLTDQGCHFIGRLKLHSPYQGRNKRPNLENHIDRFTVSEILRQEYSGEESEAEKEEYSEEAAKVSKYVPENLIPAFRKAAVARNEMLASGFTDNGGAIHSAERILDILGQRLKYPGLTHGNNLSQYPDAEFSVEALAADERGERTFIEHVSPLRDMTRQAIEALDQGASDQEFSEFVVRHYRLVLLTKEETQRLNRINRSRMTPDRLDEAGITTCRKITNP